MAQYVRLKRQEGVVPVGGRGLGVAGSELRRRGKNLKLRLVTIFLINDWNEERGRGEGRERGYGGGGGAETTMLFHKAVTTEFINQNVRDMNIKLQANCSSLIQGFSMTYST